MKCLGINLIKYMQDLYKEYYTILMNEIKKNYTNKKTLLGCQFFPREPIDSIQSHSKSLQVILWVSTKYF